jgi:hypothetical protein
MEGLRKAILLFRKLQMPKGSRYRRGCPETRLEHAREETLTRSHLGWALQTVWTVFHALNRSTQDAKEAVDLYREKVYRDHGTEAGKGSQGRR